MEIIPLITLDGRKIIETNQKTTDAKEIKKLNKDEKVYIFDYDGLEKDKPNLCLYQNTSKLYTLWIDSGPVNLGDIVDMFMSGASILSIRRNLWDSFSISKIREITENEIFLEIDLKDVEDLENCWHIFDQADGIVVFNDKELINSDYKYGSFLRRLCDKYKVYTYEQDRNNKHFWEEKGVQGLLVDINKIQEFK